MAEQGDAGEKTEEPTSKRIQQSREEGMIGKSIELSQVVSLSTAVILLGLLAPRMWQKLMQVCRWGFTSEYGVKPFSLDDLRVQFFTIVYYLIPEIAILFIGTALLGSLTTLIQTQFNFSWKLVKPKWTMLNPVSGVKRLFSLQNAIQLLKSIVKLAIISPIAYFSFFEFLPQLFGMMGVSLSNFLPFVAATGAVVFWRVMKLMLLLSILDYIWQRYNTKKKMKMSKNEVKDERKAMEGDESTKRQIQQKGLMRIRKRIMQNVRTADVVVTNPTHFAVALSYKLGEGTAPKVVAKGRNFMAQRIKKLAKEHGIPVVERKPLARALFKSVEVGHEIPYELYAAVAELLAYVYKIRGRNPFGQKKSEQNRPAGR